jgi:hypothetical protein
MIDLSSIAPSQFGVAGKISHRDNPDWVYTRHRGAGGGTDGRWVRDFESEHKSRTLVE